MQEKMDQWINWVEYDELLEGRHNAPHNLLGLHSFGRGQVLTVYRPEAERVFITDMSGKNELELEEIGEGSGFFGKYIPRKNYRAPYKVKVQYSENDVIEYVDPYCFEPQIGDEDLYYFAEGKHYEIYKKLGAHPMTINGVKGTYFAVWAPHARAVSVAGSFNMWDEMCIRDRYVRMAMNQIELKSVKELRVEYKKQALLGDVIVPVI